MNKISFIDGKWTSKKIRKRMMWDDNSRCYWCGIETILFNDYICPLPSFSATIEHVYTKSHSKRRWHKKKRKQSPMVLACYGCNETRGHSDFHQFAIKMGVEIDFDNFYN